MQLDLAALSGPELRQMLDSARGRGQAAQSYEILQEMARRRQDDRPRKRRPSEPRIITLDLGDPLEREPEFDEPAPERPLDLGRAPPPPPPPRKPAPRRLPWLGVGLVMGGVAGIALGIQMGPERLGLAAPAEAVVREAPPAPVDVAQAAPARPPPPARPAELAIEVAEATPAEAPAPQVLAIEEVKPPPAPEIVVAEAKPEPPPCPTSAAPADRAICESPDLRTLQRRLQTAYADALAAHADRTLLRERQLAWRDERSDISDPDRLAELYKARIRKLNAATAEARRLQSG